jgi:excisionase family DNA binding protein
MADLGSNQPLAPLVYTIDQVAQCLQVSRATVYRLIGDGALEAVPVRGKNRVRPQAITRYLDNVQKHARESRVGF